MNRPVPYVMLADEGVFAILATAVAEDFKVKSYELSAKVVLAAIFSESTILAAPPRVFVLAPDKLRLLNAKAGIV